MKKLTVLAILLSLSAVADTPPPGTVKLKGGTDGTTIGNSGDSLKVTGSFTPSGTQDVNVTNASIAVTGAFFQATQPVSGSLGRTWTLLNTTDSVNVGNFPATQAVTQSGSWTTGRTWSLLSGTDSVDSVQSGTWNITNISGTVSLPTGAATEASLAKLTLTQGSTTSGQSGPLSQGAVTTNTPSYTTGQTSPISVNLHGALRAKQTGFDSALIIRNDYSTTNVTTSAYVQLTASTSTEINRLHIFDSSGQDLVLATGGAGSEVDRIEISPGGWDAPIDLYIASGTRISVKAKSATASSGVLLITGLK